MTSVGILCEFLQKNQQSKMRKKWSRHIKGFRDEIVRVLRVLFVYDLILKTYEDSFVKDLTKTYN